MLQSAKSTRLALVVDVGAEGAAAGGLRGVALVALRAPLDELARGVLDPQRFVTRRVKPQNARILAENSARNLCILVGEKEEIVSQAPNRANYCGNYGVQVGLVPKSLNSCGRKRRNASQEWLGPQNICVLEDNNERESRMRLGPQKGE